MIKRKIFRAYDIRGVYPREINKDNISFIVSKLAEFYKSGKIVVAHDARLSSPILYRAAIRGLSANKKLKLIEVGLSTTPMLYFLVNYFDAQAGIMITASHNPPQFNGLKVVGAEARPLGGEEIFNIIYPNYSNNKGVLQEGSFLAGSARANLNHSIDYFKIYASHLEKSIKLRAPMKVVFDCSSGPTGRVLEKIKNKNLKIKLINSRPDGRFPSHSPDPLKKNSLSDLKKSVIKFKADLGVIFDADGDRVFFVDNLARKILPDQAIFVLAKKLNKIVVDPRVGFLIRKSGIGIVDSRVGHLFIKEIMRRKKINFGAEYSGHCYFDFKFGRKKSYFDSGIFASLIFIGEISKLKENNISLSRYIDALPRYYRSREINFVVKNKIEVINKVADFYLRQKPLKISRIDGIRIEFNNWWFNLRQSNTENLLRLNVESSIPGDLKKEIAQISELIKRYRSS